MSGRPRRTARANGRSTRLRRSAARQAPDRRPTRRSRLQVWGTATVLSAVVGAIGAVVSDLATSAEHKATDAIQETLHGNYDTSTLSTAAGPTLGLEILQGMGCDGKGWVFPLTSSQATVPPQAGPQRNGHTWDEDPAAFGAVTAGPVTLDIAATGKLDHAVLLTGLKFHVKSRRPALKGVIKNWRDGCGAGGTFRYGVVDLDSAAPYWVPNAELPKDVRASAIKFPYKVTANDPEILEITVETSRCDCTWYAELDWVDGDKTGRTLIKDHGQNFRTTAPDGLTSVTWGDPSTSPSVSRFPSASE